MNSLIAASALVAIAMISPCPAPPAVARVIAKAGPTILTSSPGSTGDPTAGVNGISMVTRNFLRHDRRQINLPPGVSQHVLDQCTQSMTNVTIMVTEKGNNTFVIKGVPSPCMTLATVFVSEGAQLYPCGNDCLTYDHLSNADAQLLRGAITTLEGTNSTLSRSV